MRKLEVRLNREIFKIIIWFWNINFLSSVSSALNSMAAIFTEDFVKHYKPGLSEERLAVVSKVISTVSGIIAFLLVFAVAEVNKTVQISPVITHLFFIKMELYNFRSKSFIYNFSSQHSYMVHYLDQSCQHFVLACFSHGQMK